MADAATAARSRARSGAQAVDCFPAGPERIRVRIAATSSAYSARRRLWLARFLVPDEGIGPAAAFGHVVEVEPVLVDDLVQVSTKILA